MASLGTAVLELATDGEKLKAGLAGAGASARDWGGKMIHLGGDISNGLRPLTSAIQNVIGDSVTMASSTEESLNKVRVVFGEAAGEIEAFAKTSSTSLGISRQKALEAAGTFGNLFTAMGIGRPVAADMSMDLLQLAADLASFNNIDPTVALEKLRAGLVGEVEPLRALGVNLTAGRIKAEAFALGLVPMTMNMDDVARATNKVDLATVNLTKVQKQHGPESLLATKAALDLEAATRALDKALEGESAELTAAQKAQAAFSLITKDTANASGDFARTSDGLANSLRIQKAEQENVQAQLGVALIPIMKELTTVLTGIVRWFGELSPEVQKVILILGGLLVVLGPLLTVLGIITGAVGLFIGIMIPAQGSILATTIAVGGLNIALGPLILIIGAVALAVFLLKLAWDNNLGGIQEKTAQWVDFLLGLFDGLRAAGMRIWNLLIGFVVGKFDDMLRVVNGFIGAYNAVAEKLGMGLIGEIKLITPNLQFTEDEINYVSRERDAQINLRYLAPPMPTPGVFGGYYQHGTDHVTRGPEVFVAGEAGPERVTVTPLSGATRQGSGAGHGHPIVMDGLLVARAVGDRVMDGAESYGLPLSR